MRERDIPKNNQSQQDKKNLPEENVDRRQGNKKDNKLPVVNSQEYLPADTSEENITSVIGSSQTKSASSEVLNTFFEKKKDAVCETCGEEFEQFDMKGIGKHATENQHYSFKLKGTNLKLAVL